MITRKYCVDCKKELIETRVSGDKLICKKCKIEKDKNQFYKNNFDFLGYQPYCKFCMEKYRREHNIQKRENVNKEFQR